MWGLWHTPRRGPPPWLRSRTVPRLSQPGPDVRLLRRSGTHARTPTGTPMRRIRGRGRSDPPTRHVTTQGRLASPCHQRDEHPRRTANTRAAARHPVTIIGAGDRAQHLRTEIRRGNAGGLRQPDHVAEGAPTRRSSICFMSRSSFVICSRLPAAAAATASSGSPSGSVTHSVRFASQPPSSRGRTTNSS